MSTALVGYAPVTVQQTTLKNTHTDVRADVITTGELSQMTQQVLRMQGVQVAVQEPQPAFQDLEVRGAREPDDDQQVALAEIALLNAMHNEPMDLGCLTQTLLMNCSLPPKWILRGSPTAIGASARTACGSYWRCIRPTIPPASRILPDVSPCHNPSRRL